MALALHRLAMHSETNTKKSNIYIYITFSGSEQERITLEKPSFMVTIYVISLVDDKINYSPMHTTPLNSLETTPYIFFGIFNPVIQTFRRPGIREDWIWTGYCGLLSYLAKQKRYTSEMSRFTESQKCHVDQKPTHT